LQLSQTELCFASLAPSVPLGLYQVGNVANRGVELFTASENRHGARVVPVARLPPCQLSQSN
jgi:hypothetical protein